MNGEKQFVDRVKRELDGQVAMQSTPLLGRLRAARRTALAGRGGAHAHRFLWPGLVSALFLAVAISTIWFPALERPEMALESMLQAATATDLQILNEMDEMELYRDLEFYYWLEQEQANAG